MKFSIKITVVSPHRETRFHCAAERARDVLYHLQMLTIVERVRSKLENESYVHARAPSLLVFDTDLGL